MLAIEAGITALAAILLHTGMGATEARSAVLGGLAFIIPQALFVTFAFRPGSAASAAVAVRGLYIGEALKLFATAALFAAGFILVEPLNAGILFAMYLGLLAINLAGNAILLK